MDASVVVDLRSKQALQRAREREEAELIRRVETAMAKGQLGDDLEDELQTRGCGGRWSCGLIGRGLRRRHAKLASADAAAANGVAMTAGAGELGATAATAGAAVAGSASERLFGRRAGTVSKKEAAVQKLHAAAESMAKRVEQLGARKSETAQRVLSLKQAGKTAEAVAMLKRLKQLEKQHASASATQIALEQQVDLLADAELQREVSAALTASLSTVKKKSKGLLSSAESAADDAMELRDLSDDVAQALGGLQLDQYDDDELLQELDAMVATESVSAPRASAAATPTATPAATATPTATPAQFPAAPTAVPGASPSTGAAVAESV